MRLRYLISLFLCGTMTYLYGQGPASFSLSAEYEAIPLKTILKSLEAERGLRFSFRDSDINEVRVSCSFREANWPWVEQRLFGAYGLRARWLEEGYVTIKRPAPTTVRDWIVPLTIADPDGNGLAYAQIGLLDSQTGGVANENGQLTLSFSASTEDTLLASNLGFEQRKLAVRDLLLSPGQVIPLTPLAIELGTIEIREYLTDGILASPDGRKVSFVPESSTMVPGFVDQEVYRLVSLLPGLTNEGETAGNLSIRGGSRDQNLILWDGIPVYSPGHYYGLISNFNAELIDKMSVLRGQADAAFGGRVAGLVNMETDRDVVSSLEGGAGISLLGADAHLKIPVAPGVSDLHLGGRSSLGVLIDAPTYRSYRKRILQSTDLEGNVASSVDDESFRFQELNGRWHWQLGDHTAVTLSGFTQFDKFQYESGSRTRFTDALRTKNEGLGIALRQKTKENQNLLVQGAFTRFDNLGENQFIARTAMVTDGRNSSIQEYSLRAQYEWNTRKGEKIKLGFQGQEFAHTLDFTRSNNLTSETQRRVLAGGTSRALAGFSTWSINRSDSPLSLELGLRAQFYEPTGDLFLEPRFDGSLRLGESWWLKAGYGENHQFPVELIDLNPESISSSAALWVLADGENFPVATGREGSIGIAAQPSTWFFDLEFYYKQVDGLSSAALDIGNRNIANGTSRNRGMNLLLKKRTGAWRSWVIYTLSSSRWRFSEISDNFFNADNDRRHELQLMNSYSLGAWSLNLGWRWHTGSRFTRVFGIREIVRPTDEGPRLFALPERGLLNAATLPAFHRLDLSLYYNWEPDDGAWSGQIAFSLINLYHQPNVLHRQFLVSEREVNPGTPNRFFLERLDTEGLGFTPNIKLSLSWR